MPNPSRKPASRLNPGDAADRRIRDLEAEIAATKQAAARNQLTFEGVIEAERDANRRAQAEIARLEGELVKAEAAKDNAEVALKAANDEAALSRENLRRLNYRSDCLDADVVARDATIGALSQQVAELINWRRERERADRERDIVEAGRTGRGTNWETFANATASAE